MSVVKTEGEKKERRKRMSRRILCESDGPGAGATSGRARDRALKNLWSALHRAMARRRSNAVARETPPEGFVFFNPLLLFAVSAPTWPGRGPVASFRRCSLSVKLLDYSLSGRPPHLFLRSLHTNSFCDPRRTVDAM